MECGYYVQIIGGNSDFLLSTDDLCHCKNSQEIWADAMARGGLYFGYTFIPRAVIKDNDLCPNDCLKLQVRSWWVPRYWTMLGWRTVLKNSHSSWNLLIGSLCSLWGAIWCSAVGSNRVGWMILAAQRRSSHFAWQTDPYDPTPRVCSLRRTTVLKLIFWSPAIKCFNAQLLRVSLLHSKPLNPIRCAIIRTRMPTTLTYTVIHVW
jgi:hypothetical protein